MAPITCRACGASTSKGDEFALIEYAKASYASLVQPGPDGLVKLWGGAEGFPEPLIDKDELCCVSCDHRWATRRAVERG